LAKRGLVAANSARVSDRGRRRVIMVKKVSITRSQSSSQSSSHRITKITKQTIRFHRIIALGLLTKAFKSRQHQNTIR
jgi:hypothetical protein